MSRFTPEDDVIVCDPSDGLHGETGRVVGNWLSLAGRDVYRVETGRGAFVFAEEQLQPSIDVCPDCESWWDDVTAACTNRECGLTIEKLAERSAR